MAHDGERGTSRASNVMRTIGLRIALLFGAAAGALFVGVPMTWGEPGSAATISVLVAVSLAGVGIGSLIKARLSRGRVDQPGTR